jgi:hypothetical protein
MFEEGLPSFFLHRESGALISAAPFLLAQPHSRTGTYTQLATNHNSQLQNSTTTELPGLLYVVLCQG